MKQQNFDFHYLGIHQTAMVNLKRLMEACCWEVAISDSLGMGQSPSRRFEACFNNLVRGSYHQVVVDSFVASSITIVAYQTVEPQGSCQLTKAEKDKFVTMLIQEVETDQV